MGHRDGNTRASSQFKKRLLFCCHSPDDAALIPEWRCTGRGMTREDQWLITRHFTTCLGEFERKILNRTHLSVKATSCRSFSICASHISARTIRSRERSPFRNLEKGSLFGLLPHRAKLRNRDQEPGGRNRGDVTGLPLTLRVPRDSEWERNHGWNTIIPGN